MPQGLQCFLYQSHFTAGMDISCVADIVKTARSFNKLHHITGMLVFDGLRFCQYIEGPADSLQVLIGRLGKDPRHQLFIPKHQAPLSGERRFSNWSMAYVLVDGEEPLNEIDALTGQSALEKMETLIPLLDIA
jgi:hypothetical protein